MKHIFCFFEFIYRLIHFILFYFIFSLTDSCPSCVQFKPELNSFIQKFSSVSKRDLNVGICDVKQNPRTAARFLLMHVPAVYHYKDNELRSLTNHRSLVNLTNYFTSEEWKTTPTSMFGPFSLISYAFLYAFTIGSTFIQFSDYVFSNYPPYLIYSSLGALVLAPLLFLIVALRKDKSMSEQKRKRDVRLNKKRD